MLFPREEDPAPWLKRDPARIQQLMPIWDWFYRHYFRVRTSGWEHVPAEGQLMFVGSHNGGLPSPDMHMFVYDWFRRFGTERRIYGLAHPKVWTGYPLAASLAAAVGAIPYHPRHALKVLEQGHGLLVYPGGGQDVYRPHRHRDRIHLAGRTGFLRLAIWHGLPIVPLISWGGHDTLIVLEDLYPLARRLHERGLFPWLFGIDPEVMPLYLGLPWGLALGPVPNLPFPVRIHTRVCPPIHLERHGHAASRDRDYVQACYRRVQQLMQEALHQLRRDVDADGESSGDGAAMAISLGNTRSAS